MTELAQRRPAADEKAPGSDYLPPAPADVDTSPPRRELAETLAWAAGGIAGMAAVVWFIFFGPGQTGSKAQWFFGAAVLIAVLVSVWQTQIVLRQARRASADAAERVRQQIASVEERASRELTLVRSIHDAEMDAQQKLARAELVAQVELARVERVQLVAQQQRLAMIGVSRAVSAQTQALATLWNHGARILEMDDREAREQAMNPVLEQMAQVVNDFSVELANAHLLIDDDRLHAALSSVNDAVLMALRVAEDVHLCVVDGKAPEPKAIPSAQRRMHEKAAEARHLAWDLLRAGLSEN